MSLEGVECGAAPSSPWHIDVDHELSSATVLITGATSAIGRALLHRLLASSSPPLLIIAFVPKQPGTARLFLEQLLLVDKEFESVCAFRFNGNRALMTSKVTIIECDISAPRLAVDLDASLNSCLRDVTIVFHCALQYSLDATITEALALSARGSIELIQFCARVMPHLSAFVLLSSVYISPIRYWRHSGTLEERLVPLAGGVSADKVLSDSMLAHRLQRSYVSPSHCALVVTEHLCASLASRVQLPLAIVRAPMLAPSLMTPWAGWCTPSILKSSPLCMLSLEVARGLIQCIPASATSTLHAVPLDALANQMILVSVSTSLDNRSYRPLSLVLSRSTAKPLSLASVSPSLSLQSFDGTIPRSTSVLNRQAHVPGLPPRPSPSIPYPSTTSSMSLISNPPRWFHAGVGFYARFGVIAEAFSAYWQHSPPKDCDGIPQLLLAPTMAHYQRDYLLRSWLPSKLALFSSYGGWNASDASVKLKEMRDKIRKLLPFLRDEWPLQNNHQMRRLISATNVSVDIDCHLALLVLCNGLHRHVLLESVPELSADALRSLSRGAHDILKESGAPRGIVSDFKFLLRSSYDTPQRLATSAEQSNLKHRVLSSSSVRNAMKDEIARRSSLANDASLASLSDAVNSEVNSILEEMAASLSIAQLRVFGFAFRKLWQTLYTNIEVNPQGFERVASLLHDGASVIYLPSHRSYMDFLVLSYVLFARHLPLPHIAAGNDFLGLSLAVHVLRVGGAFFMRRSFSNDLLYTAVLNEYVQQILSLHCSLEFFIEGTRARYGKTLRPKLGLLRTVIDAYRMKRVSCLHLVPIHINYERLVEADIYPGELLGLPKRKESIRGLIDGVRTVWNERFGRIAIEFGQPITLDSNSLTDWLSLDESSYRSRILSLGNRIVYEINSLSVWSAICLVSSVLLGSRAGLSKTALIGIVQWLRGEVIARGTGRDDWLRGESAQSLVDRALIHLSSSVLQRSHTSESEVMIVPDSDPESILLLASYRNKLLHVFALDAYVLLSLHGGSSDVGLVSSDVLFLDELLRRDIIDRENPAIAPNINYVLDALRNRDLIAIIDNRILLKQNSGLPTPTLLQSYILELFWPFIESYYLTSLFLIAASPLKIDLNTTLTKLQRMAVLFHSHGLCYAAEVSNKETLSHALLSFREGAARLRYMCDRLHGMRKRTKNVHSMEDDLAFVNSLCNPRF